MLGFALFAGCAEKGAKGTYKKLPPRKPPAAGETRKAPAEAPAEAPQRQVEKDVIRPAAPEAAMTPQHQASMRLVDRGNAQLASGDAERAATTFREAVNVDARNGVAYYSLALAESKRGQTAIAAGLLDKAEALLDRDPEWLGRIDELRTQLGISVTPRPVVPSPIDQSF